MPNQIVPQLLSLLMVRRGVDTGMDSHSEWPTAQGDKAAGTVKMPAKTFLVCVLLWLNRGIRWLLNEPRPDIPATRLFSAAPLAPVQPPVANAIAAAAFLVRCPSKPSPARPTPEDIAMAVSDPSLRELLVKIEQIGGCNRGFITVNPTNALKHTSAADGPEPDSDGGGVGTAR